MIHALLHHFNLGSWQIPLLEGCCLGRMRLTAGPQRSLVYVKTPFYSRHAGLLGDPSCESIHSSIQLTDK